VGRGAAWLESTVDERPALSMVCKFMEELIVSLDFSCGTTPLPLVYIHVLLRSRSDAAVGGRPVGVSIADSSSRGALSWLPAP
jgi:hypothetical protein